jgi:hypothetical protein
MYKIKVIYIIATLLFIMSCTQTETKTESAGPEPQVFFAIGDVTINGQPVSIGQKINNGDVVETGIQSYLEAKFQKQSAFRVREESRVVFNIAEDIILDVEKGKVLNILEKRSSYLVRTPSAVAAVRGTIFFVSVIDDGKTYFCACNGTIAIENDQQKLLTTLSSSHHKPSYCEREGEDLSMADAEMLDHDDIEIFELMYRMDKAVIE